MKALDGQIVLLTGAAGGFGRPLTRLLLREGCALILSDLRPEFLAAPAGRILGLVAADLGAPAGAAELHAAASAISSQVDILVNNAGLGIYGRIDRIPRARWEAVMQVNLLAPMRLAELFIPQMIARRGGHIVNICSAASLVGARGMGVYSASKFGLRGFTESLGADLRRHRVDVTGIYPFFTRTPILDSERFDGDERPAHQPAGLIGDPERVMAALLRGIKARRRHIYPDPLARLVDLLRRAGG
jgi:short-subunit dehydrogenase